MKILVASHYYPPHIGGIEVIVKKQVNSLRNLGNEVCLFTSRHDKKLPRIEQTERLTIARFNVMNFIENKFGLPYPLISPFHFFKLYRNIKNIDLVHIHDIFYELSHLTGLAAVIRKKPLYITQHVAMVDHPSKIVMTIQNIVYRSIGLYLFKKAQGIIVYNVNVRDFLIHLGVDRKKISQINNGVDTTFFAPAIDKDKEHLKKRYKLPVGKMVVLYVGRLVSKKGFDLVAKAGSDRYTTLIVGGGKIPAALQKLDNVIFFGPANEKQLAEIYRLSDIFILPAVGEIFTLAMQEAMACGLPIITTSDKGYESYPIKRNLIGFTERELEKIRSIIVQIINDKELRIKMSQYSRYLALERFSWEKNYSKEFRIYKNEIAT